jgi:hypothetical protein
VALKTLLKGYGRKHLKKADPLGEIVAELQDVVDAQVFQRDVELSFETNEQGTFKLYFPFACTIVRARLQVTKALSSGNTGDVTLQDSSAAAMTGGTANIVADAAVGTEATLTPNAKNVVARNSYIQLVTSKVTAGGKVRCMIEFTMNTPPPQQP